MTFFEDQRIARQKTWLLVGYLVLAVCGIILAVYLTFLMLVNQVGSDGVTTSISQNFGSQVQPPSGREYSWWIPELFLAVFFGTSAVVLLGSGYKVLSLRGGGKQVAQSLGGRLISPSTTDPNERKILNVVEEMAIASGVAVPPVYLLEDETSINAFAAGYEVDQAVIGVTRGCIELLSRDELQGVIAHEFSHILNGDMRLNIRLIGVLHGILVIGIIGYGLLRTALHARPRRSRDKEGGGQLALLALGVSLWAVGYIGVFFGRLIKAAISRQREFLADASAVQFTRNPHGIGGALKKIGGFHSGSRIQSPKAEEASHMFFANGLKSSLFGLFATHPPLIERIRRIDPHFDGQFPQAPTSVSLDTGAETVAGFASAGSAASPGSMRIRPQDVVEQVGHPQAAHLEYAKTLMHQLPSSLVEEMHTSQGAMAVVYLLLFDGSPSIRTLQWNHLRTHESNPMLELVERLEPLVSGLPPEARLPVVDLCVPALRELPASDYERFRSNVKALANADGQCSLFEYALHHILLRHVERASQPPRRASAPPPAVLSQAGVRLLETLALGGSEDPQARLQAFERGMEEYKVVPQKPFDPQGEASLDVLDETLSILAHAQPGMKQHVIAACTACIAADGLVSVAEAEILRAIGDALNCPIPPFLPGAFDARQL